MTDSPPKPEIREALRHVELKAGAAEEDVDAVTFAGPWTLLSDYLAFVPMSDGAEGWVGENYIQIARLRQAAETTKAFAEFVPGLFFSADDGSAGLFAFDLRMGHPQRGDHSHGRPELRRARPGVHPLPSPPRLDRILVLGTVPNAHTARPNGRCPCAPQVLLYVVMDAFTARTLALVNAIPAGRVLSYGDIAAQTGASTPREVGDVLQHHGDRAPWWRVVRIDGSCAPHLQSRQLDLLRKEGTPLAPSGAAVDMARARWTDGAPAAPEKDQLSLFR
ncbi:MAG TPA: MGMT family protein [Polyangiaceae bacterium]|nr:MGMT family protein [Polyangiaceae bacterium]